MTPIPPWPQEFLTRIICDTRSASAFDATAVRQQVAESLGDEDGLMEAEERALALLEGRWDELGTAIESALERVEEESGDYVSRVAEAREELEERGPASWIAAAVRAQLATDVAFDALGDIGALTEI